MYAPFIDSYGNIEYAGVWANVIDDQVYAELEFSPYVDYMRSFVWIIIGVVAVLDVLLYLALRKRFFQGLEVRQSI